MSDQTKLSEKKSRVKELVHIYSKNLKSNPEPDPKKEKSKEASFNLDKNIELYLERKDQFIGIIQNRNLKDDLAKFQPIQFQKFLIEDTNLDFENNEFNFHFKIIMPDKNSEATKLPSLKKLELQLRQFEGDINTSESKLSVISNSSSNFSNTSSQNSTENTNLESESFRISNQSFISSELGKIESKAKFDKDSRSNNKETEKENEPNTLMELYGLDQQSVNDSRINEEKKYDELMHRIYSPTNIESKHSKSESKDTGIESQNQTVEIIQANIQKIGSPENKSTPIISNSAKLQDQEAHNSSNKEILENDDLRVSEDYIKDDENNLQNLDEYERKKFIFNYDGSSSEKNILDGLEFVRVSDFYFRAYDETTETPKKSIPKITNTFFKDIESVDKVKSNKEVKNTVTETNIIDVKKYLNELYNPINKNEKLEDGLYFFDEKNNICKFSECDKYKILQIKNNVEKFLLFSSEIFQSEKMKDPVEFQYVYEYVFVDVENFSNDQRIICIKQKIDLLNKNMDNNLKEYHPVEYLKKNILGRKGSTMFHAPALERNYDIILGYEDEEDEKKMNWYFHSSILLNKLSKTLDKFEKLKLCTVLVKARQKCVRYKHIKNSSMNDFDIYYRKDFESNPELRKKNFLSFISDMKQNHFDQVGNNMNYSNIQNFHQIEQISINKKKGSNLKIENLCKIDIHSENYGNKFSELSIDIYNKENDQRTSKVEYNIADSNPELLIIKKDPVSESKDILNEKDLQQDLTSVEYNNNNNTLFESTDSLTNKSSSKENEFAQNNNNQNQILGNENLPESIKDADDEYSNIQKRCSEFSPSNLQKLSDLNIELNSSLKSQNLINSNEKKIKIDSYNY